MNRTSLFILSFLLIMVSVSCQKEGTKDYPVKPVPFTEVEITDQFWAPRMETNRKITLPFALKQNEKTGRVDNFAIAGGLKEGIYRGERYNDTDVYKVIQGAAYTLAMHPDPELEESIDSLIEVISAAQEEDGYLFTPRTASPEKPVPGIGNERWSNLAVSHELYNAGHMYEAAVAHYRATGKRNFLDVALKNADLLVKTFGPDKLRAAPGHQEVEIGLVKLYRVTRKEKYLRLAEFFLDQRGKSLKLKKYPSGSRFAIYNNPVQIQAHKPVLQQKEAVGHAVRAMYMYSAMADVAALTDSKEYIQAIDRLWENVVFKKMYLTGGVGARHHGESFGNNYELPNKTAYNETCAAIGNVMWNHRLFLLHPHAKYIDVLERTLYNGLIVGVSLDGDTFFYPNPLESDGEFQFNKGAACRQPWFGTACCPGNLVRFIPSVPGYIYAVKGDKIYVNLFIGSQAKIKISRQTVSLIQETRYPWEEDVKITVNPEKPAKFTLNIRIPGWVRNNPVPGDLYRYLNKSEAEPTIEVNGSPVDIELEKGYASLHRTWHPGDKVKVSLPLEIRRVLSHQKVKSNQGKVALERGPLVYCAEWVDNRGEVLNLSVPGSSKFKPEYKEDFLKGLVVLKGEALISDNHSSKKTLTLIPYYAWAHRGVGEMAVWLKRATPQNSL